MEEKYTENSLKESFKMNTSSIIYYYRGFKDNIYMYKSRSNFRNTVAGIEIIKGYYHKNNSFRTEYTKTPEGAYLLLEDQLYNHGREVYRE